MLEDLSLKIEALCRFVQLKGCVLYSLANYVDDKVADLIAEVELLHRQRARSPLGYVASKEYGRYNLVCDMLPLRYLRIGPLLSMPSPF